MTTDDPNTSQRAPTLVDRLSALFESPENEDPEEVRKARQLAVAIAAVVVVGLTIALGVEFGPPAVVLVLAATALILVIGTLWASVRAMLGESKLTGADAFALGAPRAEEEQKRAVLRAMKDLEFERSVGKISQEDYAILVTKLRSDAKRLLRMIDQASTEQRARAEELVAAELTRAGVEKATQRAEAEEPVAPEAEPEAKPEEPESEAKPEKDDA